MRATDAAGPERGSCHRKTRHLCERRGSHPGCVLLIPSDGAIGGADRGRLRHMHALLYLQGIVHNPDKQQHEKRQYAGELKQRGSIL